MGIPSMVNWLCHQWRQSKTLFWKLTLAPWLIKNLATSRRLFLQAAINGVSPTSSWSKQNNGGDVYELCDIWLSTQHWHACSVSLVSACTQIISHQLVCQSLHCDGQEVWPRQSYKVDRRHKEEIVDPVEWEQLSVTWIMKLSTW